MSPKRSSDGAPRPTAEEGAGLEGLVDGAPLVVCLGPGGVGKTTLSSVIALHQAATAQRSLVLTVDPARRLADALGLGLGALSDSPTAITSFAKMHPGGSLSALMLDPAATFDRLVTMLVPDSARRDALFANRFYQHLSRSLAGTLEYMAVERLHELSSSARFDRIVLDTPPTTNALDFLEAPDRLAAFFDERVTRWFMPSAATGVRSWTSRLVQRAGASVVSLLSRVAGEAFVEDTVGFFGAFADLLGGFRTRGVEVGKLLRHPRTVFLIVCAPDGNRLAEALALDERLSQAGCRAHGFIVNRVDARFLPATADAQQSIDRATALLGGEGERPRVEAFLRRLEALHAARESSAALQGEVVEALRARVGHRPVFTAPRVPASESPRAALLALYLGLFPGHAQSQDAMVEPLAALTAAHSADPLATETGLPPPADAGRAAEAPDALPVRGRRVTDADT
jgi:anion-transporting  ArsA/GET3 family ATPase